VQPDWGEVFFFFFFFVLFFFCGIETRASRMLGKRCTTELHPSPVQPDWLGPFGPFQLEVDE
jgi:hypothetical protein